MTPTLFGIELTVIGSTLAVIGTLATCVVFILKKQHAEHLVKQKEEQIDTLKAEINQLHKSIADFKSEFRANPAAFYKKDDIEKQLNGIIKLLNVEAGSIYIPSALIPDLSNLIPCQLLIFIAKDSQGRSERNLVDKLVPMEGSAAGSCYQAEKDTLTSPQHEPYYKEADEVSGFKTKDILNIYLAHAGSGIGVLQLINRIDNNKLSLNYADSVKAEIADISAKIHQFISESDNLKHIRVKHNSRTKKSTIMFCDLTHSSLFYHEYSALDATDFINEYINTVCSVALDEGAVIDNYIGDGIMFSYNQDKDKSRNPLAAVRAALAMQLAFDKIKQDWQMRAGCVAVAKMFLRIGISYGDARFAVVGHYSKQTLSLFGSAVITAAQLCDIARRDRNIIVIDDATCQAVCSEFYTQPIPMDDIKPALKFSHAAHSVTGHR
ncbi:MAG: adenylate/guanylate cyclase domain-containing protein [Rheinheimera sp.]|nr:adenylate/guanylate cyclase domain-containing protein [Rheinheimera sp.]